MLANLVDNALAYTPADGRVTVRCGLTAATPAQSYVEVEDDGPEFRPTSARASRHASIEHPEPAATVAAWGWRSSTKSSRGHHALLDSARREQSRHARARDVSCCVTTERHESLHVYR
jgi:two-component system sensor histidine kinase TctE